MARKIGAKLIIELREQGQSRRKIAKAERISMESACNIFDIASERGISRGEVKCAPDDDAYRYHYRLSEKSQHQP